MTNSEQTPLAAGERVRANTFLQGRLYSVSVGEILTVTQRISADQVYRWKDFYQGLNRFGTLVRFDASQVDREVASDDTGTRVELPSGSAIVVDLDVNLHTGGDPDLVVLSFTDGSTVTQLVSLPRSVARELAAVLARATN